MIIENIVGFPVTIRFENGEFETYENKEDLIFNLEDFDSDLEVNCDVRDAQGRKIRLKIHLLILRTLELARS
ncbi:MAG: hypothetical protein WKF34_07180 [Pyrinomonadaceae bacterium]